MTTAGPGPGERPAARTAWLLETPRGFALLLAAYALLHLALRVLVSPVLTIDDARETVFAQTLAWGYQPRQPPLYNWLVWAAFRLVGPGVLGLNLVKYAVLAAAYAFVYASARRALPDRRLPAVATFGLLLVVPVSWILHEALTHSVAALAACAATFYALLRVEASGRPGAYLALGTALGLGLLSKFSYAVFAVALLLAAATLDRFRSRILSPRFLLTLGVAAALVLPFALWYAEHGFAFLRMASAEVRTAGGGDRLDGVLDGLFYVGKVTLIYATPLWLACLALFPQVYRRPVLLTPAAPAGARLVERFQLGVMALLTVAALAALLTFLKFRWLIPGFFLLPLYAFVRLARTPADDGRLRAFALLLLAAEAAVVGGILLRIYTGSLGGRPYKLNEPYDVVAARLREAGFRGGTVVTGLGPLAGNLRLSFPRARFVSLESPYFVPPADGDDGCLVAWEKGPTGSVPEDLRDFLAAALDVRLSGAEPVATIEAPYHHTRDHVRRVSYLLLPGTGRCR